MLTLENIEHPSSIISYWNDRAKERAPFLYQSLFTMTYTESDTVNLIYGENEPSRMLTATTDDVKAIKINNIGFESDTFKLIPFKNYKAMDEKRRSEIKNALANNADQAQIQAIANVQYQDPANLITDAQFTREIMAMQALTTGIITVNSGDLNYKRDFGMPAEHKVQVGTEWGTMDSSPLDDIQTQIDKISDDNGTTITYALMNGRTFRKIASSGEVINSLLLGKTNTNVAISQPAVKQLILDTLGVTVLIDNKGVGSDRFVPDDTVVLMPDGAMGRLAWTDTNEDLGLIGDPTAQLSRTADGITLYTDRQHDPVGTQVHVSQKILPTFDKVRNVVIMSVGPDPKP